ADFRDQETDRGDREVHPRQARGRQTLEKQRIARGLEQRVRAHDAEQHQKRARRGARLAGPNVDETAHARRSYPITQPSSRASQSGCKFSFRKPAMPSTMPTTANTIEIASIHRFWVSAVTPNSAIATESSASAMSN